MMIQMSLMKRVKIVNKLNKNRNIFFSISFSIFCTVCQEDLIDISEDIELKSKLIEQLEMTKNRMEKMRQIYEEKLNVLNSKIINTQRERDQVLANMSASMSGSTNSPLNNDKTKKVREEYERKISDMQKELKKLQIAQREHARQHREIQSQETQLRTLKAELSELKSVKVQNIRYFHLLYRSVRFYLCLSFHFFLNR